MLLTKPLSLADARAKNEQMKTSMSENYIGQCDIRFLHFIFFIFFILRSECLKIAHAFNIDALFSFFFLFFIFFPKGGGRTVKGAQRPIQGGSGRRAMHNLAQLQVLAI
jgi:hypothetical protein